MRFGLVLPLFSGRPERVLEVAAQARDLGYDGVFAFDHFFPPGGRRDQPSLEAFSILGAVAAAFPSLTIGTLVTRAGLRPVGMLAKLAASLDHMSGGRFVLGIGTGDPLDAPEHDAYGIPVFGKDDRRRNLEETISAVQALFAGRPFDGGDFVPPVRGPLAPPPPTPGGPPVWVGGQADAVVRIAARVADGWNGWGMDAELFGSKVALLRDEARAAGRNVEATWAGLVLAGKDDAEADELLEARRARGMRERVWHGSVERLIGFLGDLEAAGATWVVATLVGPPDRLDLVSREVLPSLSRDDVL